jgi:zinc finger-like protein
LCHDEEEDHKIDRYAVKEMVCKLCHARQPIAGSCRNCGELMAKYYCPICHLYDDSGHDIYHCPSCNVCRRGKGLGIDFFHCMKCNACMSLSLYKRHTCREQSLEANCVVCHEYLFDSATPIKELPCGHFMHSSCLAEYSRHNYTCPICAKSMGDMRVYFQMLDALVASERLPPEIASRRQGILCNDCSVQGTAPYHWVYHKCGACGSYNTRIL